MTIYPAWRVGNRPDGRWGFFVAAPGGDALNDADVDLLFSAPGGNFQIAQMGVVSKLVAFPQIVPHSLDYAPFVFPSLIADSAFPSSGYIRPFDNGGPGPWISSQIKSEPFKLTVSQSGTPTDVNYLIMNVRAP